MNENSSASGGDAHTVAATDTKITPPGDPSPTEISTEVDGDGMATLLEPAREDGDAPASEEKSIQDQDPVQTKATQGDALMLINDARLHLVRDFDLFLDERYVQKQLKETKRILGEKKQRAAGGSEWLINQASLEQFARDLLKGQPERRLTTHLIVKGKDRTLDELRILVESKPYDLVIEGDAPPAPSGKASPSATNDPKPADPPTAEREVEPVAPLATGDAVPREFYDDMKIRADKAEQELASERTRSTELTNDLTNDLRDAYERYAKLADRNADLSEKLAAITDDQPKTILDGFRGFLGLKQPDVERVPKIKNGENDPTKQN